jgi:hypothetical protein
LVPTDRTAHPEFSADGEFLGWSTRVGLERRRKEGDFYIAEQEDGDNPAHVCVKKVGTDVFKFRGSARLDPENR